jgi:hypothetical protein
VILYPPIGGKSIMPSVEIDTTAATTAGNERIGGSDADAPPFDQRCDHPAAMRCTHTVRAAR